MGSIFCSVTLISTTFPFFVTFQIGEDKLHLIFVGILNLGMGLCKALLITFFMGVGMELEFVGSSYYGCIKPLS